MSFDVQAFLTGLAGSVAEGIDRKGKEAREYGIEEKRRAEGNKATISQRRARVQQVMGYTKLLEDQGASSSQIQAVLSSGPEQIQVLANKVQKAVEANNGQKLGTADITAMISMPESFSPLDMDLDQFVQRTYGVYDDLNATQSAAEDVSIWDRFTGDAAMKNVNAKLNTTPMYENLTAQDINEMAAQKDYEALVPSTFAMVSDFKVFNGEAMRRANNNLADLRADLNRNGEYTNALDTIDDLKLIREGDPEQEEKYQAAVRAKEQLEKQYFSPHFISLEQDYGPQLLSGPLNILAQMGQYMGADYVNDLQEGYGVGSTDSLEATSEKAKIKIEEKIEPVVVEPAKKVVYSNPAFMSDHTIEVLENAEGLVLGANILNKDGTPTGDTLDAESAQTAIATFFSNDAGRQVAAPQNLSTFSLEDMPSIDSTSITKEVWDDMSRPQREAAGLPVSSLGGFMSEFASPEDLAAVDLKRNADPSSNYLVVLPGMNLNRPYMVSGSDLAYIPDAAITRSTNRAVISEMTEEDAAELSEDSRAFKTMPGSRLSKMYGTEGNTVTLPKELTDEEKAAQEAAIAKEEQAEQDEEALSNKEESSSIPIKDSVRKKAARMLDVPVSTLVEMQDKGELTEMGLALLVDSGNDMVDFLVEKGVSDTFEVFSLLSEWADKNKKILPMNKAFLLTTVGKKAMREVSNQ